MQTALISSPCLSMNNNHTRRAKFLHNTVSVCPFFHRVWIKSSSVLELRQEKPTRKLCCILDNFVLFIIKIIEYQHLLTPDHINKMSLMITLKVKTMLISLLFKSKFVEKWNIISIWKFKYFAHLNFRIEDRLFQKNTDKI